MSNSYAGYVRVLSSYVPFVPTLRHMCPQPREIQVLPSSTLLLGTVLSSMPLHFATASSSRWITAKFAASHFFLVPEPFHGGRGGKVFKTVVRRKKPQ